MYTFIFYKQELTQKKGEFFFHVYKKKERDHIVITLQQQQQHVRERADF